MSTTAVSRFASLVGKNDIDSESDSTSSSPERGFTSLDPKKQYTYGGKTRSFGMKSVYEPRTLPKDFFEPPCEELSKRVTWSQNYEKAVENFSEWINMSVRQGEGPDPLKDSITEFKKTITESYPNLSVCNTTTRLVKNAFEMMGYAEHAEQHQPELVSILSCDYRLEVYHLPEASPRPASVLTRSTPPTTLKVVQNAHQRNLSQNPPDQAGENMDLRPHYTPHARPLGSPSLTSSKPQGPNSPNWRSHTKSEPSAGTFRGGSWGGRRGRTF